MTTAFLAWRAPQTRRWHTIGQLTALAETDAGPTGAGGAAATHRYEFQYTGGVEEARREADFAPLASFPELDVRYVSDELFPLFANRLLSPSRPEYKHYVDWLTVPNGENDPLALLARSGGRRETDAFELYPCPEPTADGTFVLHFLAHGLRYFAPESMARAERLQPGERLLLLHDLQNPHDPHAVMLRTAEATANDIYPLGFCPRYLVNDVFTLFRAARDEGGAADLAQVVVVRVNPPPAPPWSRILCQLIARWPAGYRPFSDAAHQPVAAERTVIVPGRRRGHASRHAPTPELVRLDESGG